MESLYEKRGLLQVGLSFTQVFEKAALAKLVPLEMDNFENSLKTYRVI